MNKAIIYARVSTKEQAEEGYSLASQIKLLREYAHNGNLQLVREFIVPESASGHQERKTFKEMMEYCKKHAISHVLCEKVDRITRNLQDAVIIDIWLQVTSERQIHFVKQNLVIHQNAKSYEKFQWDIYVVLARQYSNNLSEETKKGLVEKAEEGWYPGSAKRGYITAGERGHKIWQIDRSETSEAQFIAKAFLLYSQGGHTIRAVRDILFEEGWMSSSGKCIAKGVLHTIFKDPFYCGRFAWNGQVYKGNHEPLITEELFALVQKKLTRVLKKGKLRKHSFLYAGLFSCAGCGGSITAEAQKGHIYYRCTRHKPCAQKSCIREEVITRQILSALEAVKIPYASVMKWLSQVLKDCHEAEKEYHASVMKELTDKLVKVKGRIDVLYDDRADKRIDEEFFDRKLAQYGTQQEDVLSKIRRHKEAAIGYAKTASDIVTVAQRAKKLFEKMEDEDKRELLRFVLTNLQLDNGQLRFSYKRPFDKVREIASFQPQKSEIEQVQLGHLPTLRPVVLPREDISSNTYECVKLLQDWFGILEFPQTFAEQAERFAGMQL